MAAPLQRTASRPKIEERAAALCRFYGGLLADSDGLLLRQAGETRIKCNRKRRPEAIAACIVADGWELLE